MKNKIAGYVTLYNSNSNLMNSINSYLDEIDKLYIIDNTPDRDISKDFKKNKKIVYIANKKNIGIASALNKGCELAIKDGYNFLLTMDQDSVFEKNSLKKLIKFVNEKDMSNIGILSPWHETGINVQKPKIEVEEMIEVMTSGNILNLDIYKKVGRFLDEYFIDSVDIEYCMRLNKNGYKVLRLNDCILIHELGNKKMFKIGKRTIYSFNHSYIRKYYIARNTLYLYDMYKDDFKDYCKYLKSGIFKRIRKIILIENDKYRKIRSLYRGYKDYKKKVTGEYPYNN